jgi:DNA adenine methylase
MANCRDFRQTLELIRPQSDFVYLDPPYQGTSGTRDARYCSGVRFSELAEYLEELNQLNVMFALSYDGMKGEKVYGIDLPSSLRLHKIVLDAGRSTQSTLLGKSDITDESLYLSHALTSRLNLSSDSIPVSKLHPAKAQSIYVQQMSFEFGLT